jgi:hypothetical protein
VSSQEARGAFDIKAEPDAIRDEYGRNAAGQRMLLSRRLVEAGVRFVTLSYGGWDMHQKISDNIHKTLPAFDQAYAALIRDLEQRGLLASTVHDGMRGQRLESIPGAPPDPRPRTHPCRRRGRRLRRCRDPGRCRSGCRTHFGRD